MFSSVSVVTATGWMTGVGAEVFISLGRTSWLQGLPTPCPVVIGDSFLGVNLTIPSMLRMDGSPIRIHSMVLMFICEFAGSSSYS
jgi:hypothetical protein